MICVHFGKVCISAGCPHDTVHLQCEPHGAADARRKHGYDDSSIWLLLEGVMLCLFENLTGTEIAAVQTVVQLGMIFGRKKATNWFMSSEKASHSLAKSPV